MVQSEDLGILVFVIAIACAAKILPTLIMGKILTRRTWRYCLTLGILMNTRGLVELIVLNIGLDAKILSIKMCVCSPNSLCALLPICCCRRPHTISPARNHSSFSVHFFISHSDTHACMYAQRHMR